MKLSKRTVSTLLRSVLSSGINAKACQRRFLLMSCVALALLLSSCTSAEDSATNTNSAQEASIAEPHAPTTMSTNANATVSMTASMNANMRSAGNAGAQDSIAVLKSEAESSNTERYDQPDDNSFHGVARAPLSTFSVDVDTASYSNTRRFLNSGQLPPKDAVRVEEFINYFLYDYPQPVGSAPFSVATEVSECPWNTKHRLVHIGLQGRSIQSENLPPANLVFLVDVSGSMQEPDKLPLVKSALRMLTQGLTARDRIAIVVYAGSSGLVLPPTSGDKKSEILTALGELQAGGSTNGGEGIMLAYRVAQQNFIKNGTNRVILATDGDFNVGVTNQSDLVRLIEEKRRSGVFLTVLGFGRGNLNDSTMEKLADKGNGNYAYIDTVEEARKVMGHEIGGTLATIAKDVKIQVEFKPQQVSAYRLVGYENRLLNDQDFNDDTKDAGEIGAGHTVTALYEVVPRGQKVEGAGVDPLKYQRSSRVPNERATSGELMTIKLRYKEPEANDSKLLSISVVDSHDTFQNASENLKFSSAVAMFGMLLRDSKYKGNASYDNALQLARASTGADLQGYRGEFVKLAETAKSLSKRQSAQN